MEKFILKQYDLFLEDLKTIVNIDSSSEYAQGIEQVALFFKKRFETMGMKVTLSFLGEGKVPCLEAVNKPGNTPYDFMFLGHMDTVFPKGEVKKRPFSIQDTQAFGPGVCDMKGGLLVVLHVLETLHHEGILDQLSLCVSFNGDEETGSRASREWIRSNADKSCRVFVFEPCRPGYCFVVQRKGGGWFHVTADGVSAHAGADPEKGINAVVELAHQTIAIDSLNSQELGTSAQVTVVNGGDKVNIIPSRAQASVDVRIAKKEEKNRVEDFFNTLSKNPYLKGAKISVQGSIDRPPMECGPEAQKLFDLIQSTAAGLGIKAGSIATGGCSDGNFTSAQGTPTIDGMGLVGANSHREDEYVELSSISNMVTLVSRVVKSFISS
jgi:glutamate carboxypeptidase